MSKLIDRATAHFQEVLSQGLRGPIEIPEWGANVYYKPATTMAEQSKISELAAAGKTTEALVVGLITRARDENGELLFSMGDKARLMNAVDPNVILKIVTQMNSYEDEMTDILGN
jgi:hypothetical protein